MEANNQVVTKLGTKIDPHHDQIRVNRRIIKPPPRGIILLNKPRGVVSTLSDPEGRPTVAHYMTKHYLSYFPVGRLDFDSTGLIIMTNDGEMAERLMHPRYGFDRTYHVRVEGVVSETVPRKMEEGVRLEDGMMRAQGRILSSDKDSSWLEVTVSEGRNRIVRRLMDKLRHPVVKLQRVAYGPFKLGSLPPGSIRKLTEKEYGFYREKVMRYDASKKDASNARRDHRREHQKPTRRRD